jgi:hypothetical protein
MKKIFVFVTLLAALFTVFTFSSCNSAGNSTGSGDGGKKEIIPGVPDALTVTPKADGFLISWTAAADADLYEMLYNTSDAAPGAASVGVEVDGTSVEIGGGALEPNTVYYVWVRSLSAITTVISKSDWSEAAQGKTLNDGYVMYSFSIDDSIGTIVDTNITIKIPHDADLAHLSPEFTVSEGASADFASGAERDFSNAPLEYAITSENGKKERKYTIIVNQQGGGSFAFVFNDAGATALPDDPVVIYKTPGAGQSNQKILTIAGDFTSYQWFVDNLPVTTLGSGASFKTFTLKAADYTAGGHNLSVTVYKGAALYSCELSFTVVE